MIMKKYNEETKTICFRIPISEIANVRELVYDYLNRRIQENRERVLTNFINEVSKPNDALLWIAPTINEYTTSGHESTGVGVNSLDITNIPASNTFKWLTENADARYKPVNYNESIAYECGCTYSNNLFQRKKGCGLTKVQHTEAIGQAVIKLTTITNNTQHNGTT